MNQLTLDLARDRGTAAGQACVDKADRTAPGWSERAYDAIRRFAAGQAGAFTIDSLGGAFIRAIEGDPHCVIGLSLPTLRDLTLQLGVEYTSLWNR